MIGRKRFAWISCFGELDLTEIVRHRMLRTPSVKSSITSVRSKSNGSNRINHKLAALQRWLAAARSGDGVAGDTGSERGREIAHSDRSVLLMLNVLAGRPGRTGSSPIARQSCSLARVRLFVNGGED